MDITISKLSEIDQRDGCIAQLARWHHDEWLHLNPGATLESRLKRYQSSVSNSNLPELFVAFNGETLLGSATLAKNDMDTREFLTPWLASLYVATEYREHGVASTLIEYVLSYAKQHEFKNIYLFTEDQTDFYQHRGWHLIESVEYRDAEVDLMSLKLN